MIENQLKTVLLLGILTGLLLGVGSLFGPLGVTIAFIFVLLMNIVSYWFSDKIILTMYRARLVREGHELHNIVREISHVSNLSMPKVYIIPSQSINAFATGRSPNHSAVAATEGILNILTRDELKGVMAHEVAHIKNRDTLISTIAATIAGVVGYAAFMARWAALFGGIGVRDRNGNGMVELLVLAVIMPVLATIIRLAISRSREYLADETGARMINNPIALASALNKLEKGTRDRPMREATPATAHIFIVNPFSGKQIFALLSTHPPTEDRIRKLKSMS